MTICTPCSGSQSDDLLTWPASATHLTAPCHACNFGVACAHQLKQALPKLISSAEGIVPSFQALSFLPRFQGFLCALRSAIRAGLFQQTYGKHTAHGQISAQSLPT
eukprot:1160383-Pelagomonas_calceolata.AAC.2